MVLPLNITDPTIATAFSNIVFDTALLALGQRALAVNHSRLAKN